MENKKILIVDDEPHIVELVRVCLEESDFTILEAYDGQDALEKIRENKPDLVLLDVMLPRVDGFEVCQKIKEDSATAGIPVIILTARGQEIDKAKGFQCGADAYLTKPFSPLRLLAEVKQRLEKSQEAPPL